MSGYDSDNLTFLTGSGLSPTVTTSSSGDARGGPRAAYVGIHGNESAGSEHMLVDFLDGNSSSAWASETPGSGTVTSYGPSVRTYPRTPSPNTMGLTLTSSPFAATRDSPRGSSRAAGNLFKTDVLGNSPLFENMRTSSPARNLAVGMPPPVQEF